LVRSENRLLTAHAGTLPRPPELLDIIGSHFGTIAGEDKEAFQRTLPGLVKDIVKQQVEVNKTSAI
jgi:hypothetical protein